MSIVRRSQDCDIYLYHHIDGHYICSSCPISPALERHETLDELRAHVHAHRLCGHKIGAALANIDREQNGLDLVRGHGVSSSGSHKRQSDTASDPTRQLKSCVNPETPETH